MKCTQEEKRSQYVDFLTAYFESVKMIESANTRPDSEVKLAVLEAKQRTATQMELRIPLLSESIKNQDLAKLNLFLLKFISEKKDPEALKELLQDWIKYSV